MEYRELHLIEPALTVTLHPRLTVVAGDDETRDRIVDALARVAAGGRLDGTLSVGSASVVCAGRLTAPPDVALGSPVVSPGDLDVGGALLELTGALGPARDRLERAEREHAALAGDAAAAEAAYAAAVTTAEEAAARRAAAGADRARAGADLGTATELRDELAALVDAVAGLDDPGSGSGPAVVEQGTVLAGALAGLGVCPPDDVRALLRLVDAVAERDAAGGAALVSEVVALAARLDHAVTTGLADDAGSRADLDAVERAAERLEAAGRARAAARSLALAAFAERETAKRAVARLEADRAAEAARLEGAGASPRTGDVEPVPLVALRRRIADLAGRDRLGVLPVVLDDPLAVVDDDDVPAVLRGLRAESARVQLVYVTADPAVLAWAETLHPEEGTLAQVTLQGALFPA